MTKIYTLLFLVCLTFSATSQEESEACIDPSKKVMKLIKAGFEAEDARSAVDNFSAAIAMDDGNATVYYEYGMYAYDTGVAARKKYPNPAIANKSFLKAEEMFSIALDLCSDFHGNCTYYLGIINFTQNDKPTAIKWFKEFKKFKHSDTERYPEDYTKKLKDVNEVLIDLEREAEIKNNEVPYLPSLVKNVSTNANEYFPMISPDNEMIFYTRRLDRKHLGDIKSNVVEEITFSTRGSMLNDFNGGDPLRNPFNDGSYSSYGAATLSVDNKEMIVCACQKVEVHDQPYMNCDLYVTSYERSGEGGNDFSWTPLENMGSKINTPDGWEAQPSLSADGNTLFYTVNRPSSRSNDIYIAQRNDAGEWGSIRPFDEVNTAGKDKSPFLHQDSETLYFVSEVSKERPGVGGLDIFYVRENNGKWSEPINIGYPINTSADELGLFVSIDGEVAYFSSRLGGRWNIYSFELYEEARPQSVALIRGDLKDHNGEAIDGATIEIAYEGSGEITKIKVNGNDGKYAAIIKTKKKQDVMVTVKKEGHAFDSKIISKEEISRLSTKPVVNKEPIVNKESIASKEPLVNKEPIVNKESIASKDPAVNKEPIVNKESVTSKDPVVNKEPTVNVKTQRKEVVIRDANFSLKELKVGESYTINDILFETNSFTLNSKTKFILRGFARFLKENGTISVDIQGHTDDVGDAAKNLILSDNRAKEVKKYLASQGVSKKKLSAKGYGETKPKVENTSSINRAKNRRTDFVIKGL